MNPLAAAFPAPHSLVDALIAAQTRVWNGIVGARCIRRADLDTSTHAAFLHPTKGFRFIRKERLGL